MHYTFTINITILIEIKNIIVLICIHLEFLLRYIEYILERIEYINGTYDKISVNMRNIRNKNRFCIK